MASTTRVADLPARHIEISREPTPGIRPMH
jgi:hypothetical protein